MRKHDSSRALGSKRGGVGKELKLKLQSQKGLFFSNRLKNSFRNLSGQATQSYRNPLDTRIPNQLQNSKVTQPLSKQKS